MKTKTIHNPAATVLPKNAGAKTPTRKTRFKIKQPNVKSVYLVGSFTAWEVRPIPMVESTPGVWEIEVELPLGRHEYLFLTDDGNWLQDSDAIDSVPNPWGGSNSVQNIDF